MLLSSSRIARSFIRDLILKPRLINQRIASASTRIESSGMSTERATSILEYWYGPEYKTNPVADYKKWYDTTGAVDTFIKENFTDDLDAIARGDYDSWLQSGPFEAMAGIVIMDQFTRNAYRGIGQAFSLDPKALSWADTLLSTGASNQLPYLIRVGLFLTHMHSENLDNNDRGIDLTKQEIEKRIKELDEGANHDEDPALKAFKGSLQFALLHRESIAKFGRYPKRNKALGRESTEEEAKGLEDGSIKF